MNWKLKAGIQRAVSLLPSDLSYRTYYWMQRHFGGLKNPNPISQLQAGINIVDLIHKHDRTTSKTFLEVGTGRRVNLPIALWLCGAKQVITVDLNPYLKPELIFRDIAYIRDNRGEIVRLFGTYSTSPLFQERLSTLVTWPHTDIGDLLHVMNIKYLAPANAARLNLGAESIDYHVSFSVLEHIPPEMLRQILLEGKRIIRSEGLFIHCIDFSDHFAHSDSSISTVNFLQFSESRWANYTGNRYMYHNRLRVDEFTDLVAQAELNVVFLKTSIDLRAQELLQDRLPLDERFQGKPIHVNAASDAWLVAMKSRPVTLQSGQWNSNSSERARGVGEGAVPMGFYPPSAVGETQQSRHVPKHFTN